MVVESVFTERSVGLVEAGAWSRSLVNIGLFPCRVMPKILEISIHSAALFGTQHVKNRGSFF